MTTSDMELSDSQVATIVNALSNAARDCDEAAGLDPVTADAFRASASQYRIVLDLIESADVVAIETEV